MKCFYCDFAAFSGQKRAVPRYLRALEAEAGLAPAFKPDTLYIGGGTPSELEAGEIKALLALIRAAYPGAEFREATFEANPESLSPEKIRILKDSGITRLSLGLQTTDAALLKAIGRRHTFEDFLAVYAEARRAGGFSISVDLMYGLPGQALSSCLESLDLVLDLGPEHLSLYGLQVEDQTLFARRQVEPDEDMGRAMFEASLDRIEAAGYRHYEISNFARAGQESLHNQIYWRGGRYVGLGCGAASYWDGVRSMNEDRLLPYCEKVESGRRPVAESESLEGKEGLGERILLGLRLLDGLELVPEMEAQFAGEWKDLQERGLVSRRGRRARLTREGVFLANQAFMSFVAPFSGV